MTPKVDMTEGDDSLEKVARFKAALDQLIERIAVLYKEKADTLRVIGYASAPSAGADPLDSYRAALDRAQAVAKILGGAGMPANRVQPEATPGAGAGNGRVEIQLVPMTTAGPAQ